MPIQSKGGEQSAAPSGAAVGGDADDPQEDPRAGGDGASVQPAGVAAATSATATGEQPTCVAWARPGRLHKHVALHVGRAHARGARRRTARPLHEPPAHASGDQNPAKGKDPTAGAAGTKPTVGAHQTESWPTARLGRWQQDGAPELTGGRRPWEAPRAHGGRDPFTMASVVRNTSRLVLTTVCSHDT